MSTGYLWHELYGWHDTGSGTLFPADPDRGSQPIAHHVAHPDTKRRLHELVCVSGLVDHLTRVAPRPATEEELLRVHTPAYVERVRRDSALPKGADAGDRTYPFGKGAYRIAALAAGGAVAMTEAVVRGEVDHGYALVNPPGHHALPATGMGFCRFNNVSVAVKHAQAALGVGKVAVVDWDVHHGNGTQAVFADDASVLTVSVHQDRCFPPDSGHLTERGTGPGLGFDVNLPLPPGTGDGGYAYAAEQVIAPALARFAPELVVVSCGFDAGAMDPMARQLVTSRGFVHLTQTVLAAGVPVVLVQEGGYSPAYVPYCGLATIQALAGVHVMDDALLPVFAAMGGHDLEPHQRARVDEVVALHGLSAG